MTMLINAQMFDLSSIRLLDGPFNDNLQRGTAYLLNLDADRLLHNFRVTAGLPTTAHALGGWESPDCELRGHTMGHLLSALALMYAGTGDERLKAKADYLVNELAQCQASMPSQGYKEGYLSAFPEKQYDRWQKHRSVWAPYYVLHKIMAGLLEVYRHCGNQQAFDVLLRKADWLQRRIGPLSHVLIQIALTCEPGGITEVLADLYSLTGNPDHLKLSLAFNHEVFLDSLAQGEDCLDDLHANTQIPKVIGAARQYELTGDRKYRDSAEFFWRRVALYRSWAIGGNSDEEFFFSPAESSRHLSALTAETCNTYNMLKLTRHLFSWSPSAEVMDFYERALYNHILGSQDPDSGQMIYFASLRLGHFKLYSTPHDSFWCCTGTGMENHAKYGDTIYSHDDKTLYVNLFIASELRWKEKGVTLRQETKFPGEDRSRLTFGCVEPVNLTLKIRRPGWAGEGFAVAINGTLLNLTSVPGSYISLNRTWQQGDTVEISLPMQLRFEALPDDLNTAAVCYGPIVLAAELGHENLPQNNEQSIGSDHHSYYQDPVPESPKLRGTTWEAALARIERADDQQLAFRTVSSGNAGNVSLIPFYRLHHQRYTIYMQLSE